MRPLAKRTKGVYPPLLEGMRDPRRHQRAGIASAHHPPALKTTARSEFPLELVDLATPSPSREPSARTIEGERVYYNCSTRVRTS